MPDVTPKRLREMERIHLLRILAQHGPMFASDLADRANQECDHDAFEDLPTISRRAIGQKLTALWSAGLVARELVKTVRMYRWSISEQGREVAATDPWDTSESAPAPVVDDEMVQLAVNAFFGYVGWNREPLTAMRLALEAVLRPAERRAEATHA